MRLQGFKQGEMTNQEVEMMLYQVLGGTSLSPFKQKEILKALLRANRRILLAKSRGFDFETAESEARESISRN